MDARSTGRDGWLTGRRRAGQADVARDHLEARLAERDAEIAGLRRRLAEVEAAAVPAEAAKPPEPDSKPPEDAPVAVAAGPDHASFVLLLSQYKALVAAAHAVGTRSDHTELKIPYKLQNNALAASHGVPTPRLYRVWASTDDVDLGGLPDGIVVKSDSGTNAYSVFPLRRVPGSDRWSLVDGSRSFDSAELGAAMKAIGEKALSPYLAEELLESVDASLVPDDIKVYCSYGTATQVLLVRPHAGGVTTRHRASRRYVTPSGQDLGEVLPGARYDHDIPVPSRLAEIVDAARHLSRAVGVAFCRVDFYETPTGFAFGEITRAPGGAQRYTPAHDRAMGEAWADGQARLNRDLMHGRPVGMLYGDQPYTWPYPHHDNPRRPNHWERRHAPCADWCEADPA